MHRVALAVAAVAAAALFSVAVVMPASAVPPTGPDTPACAEANVRVDNAAHAAVNAADLLAAAQKNLAAELAKAVKTAQAEHDTALDVFTATPTGDTLAELVAAQLGVQKALAALENAAAPGPETDALDAAEKALAAAIAARTAACTAPAPEPTLAPTDPAPTTTPAPEPGSFFGLDCDDFASPAEAQKVLDSGDGDPTKLDADGDGDACEPTGGGQVKIHPKGGVDTGGWPK